MELVLLSSFQSIQMIELQYCVVVWFRYADYQWADFGWPNGQISGQFVTGSRKSLQHASPFFGSHSDVNMYNTRHILCTDVSMTTLPASIVQEMASHAGPGPGPVVVVVVVVIVGA